MEQDVGKYHIDKIRGQKIAIACPTQEEWDKVATILKRENYEEMWRYNKEESCINPHSSYSDRNYYTQKEYTIISANQFLADNGVSVVHEYKVGDWVVTTSKDDNFVNDGMCGDIGVVYQIAEINASRRNTWYRKTKTSEGGKGDGVIVTSLRPALPHEIPHTNQWKVGDRFWHKEHVKNNDIYGWFIREKGSNYAMETADGKSKLRDFTYTNKEIDRYIATGEWIPYPSQIPVTTDNAYIGMRVVRGKDWTFSDQDTRNGGTGIGEVTKLSGSVYGDITVKWEGSGNEWGYYMNKLYLYSESSQTNQSLTNNQTNQKTSNNEQESGNIEYTGNSLNLRANTESYTTGKRRTGTPVCSTGQSEHTNGRYQSYRKITGYCEEV